METQTKFITVTIGTALQANNMLSDSFRRNFEMEGSNCFTFQDEDIAIGAAEMFEEHGVEIIETNVNF